MLVGINKALVNVDVALAEGVRNTEHQSKTVEIQPEAEMDRLGRDERCDRSTLPASVLGDKLGRLTLDGGGGQEGNADRQHEPSPASAAARRRGDQGHGSPFLGCTSSLSCCSSSAVRLFAVYRKVVVARDCCLVISLTSEVILPTRANSSFDL